jgi:hypothetical protein
LDVLTTEGSTITKFNSRGGRGPLKGKYHQPDPLNPSSSLQDITPQVTKGRGESVKYILKVSDQEEAIRGCGTL